MFDKAVLRDILVEYKKDFPKWWWNNEKYKWEAIKCFQRNWDIDIVAENFADMLKRSLSKTDTLLVAEDYFPREMIVKLAQKAPEEVRSMFRNLFTEDRDFYERMEIFKGKADELCGKYGNGKEKSCQDEHAASVYLWLRFPDKYYIYKYTVLKDTSEMLKSGYTFKGGDYENNIRNCVGLYDEICDELKKDNELRELLRLYLTDAYHSDTELKTLTSDVGFYIQQQKKNKILPFKWSPENYDPGLTKEDWIELLKDSDVFTKKCLEIMCRMKDCGGQASCTQLSNIYGETKKFYNSNSVDLARRISKKKGCPAAKSEDGKTIYWPVLYTVREAGKDEESSYIWKLRDGLSEALKEFDFSGVSLYAENKPAEEYTREDFLNDVFMSEESYNQLVTILKNKKNVVLQGPPGVGKTYAAKRLAYSVMGVKDENHIEFVQFHQSYSYEDFIMGYKPVKDGFELRYGIFYSFCRKAAVHPDKDFFFIIDEINRGNISKIFGELLMLIEKDYRGTELTLPYDGLPFSVPENLHIIGMMNTADRSLAMLDYALRRRFSFFDMEPAFDSNGFKNRQNAVNNKVFVELIVKIKDLNKAIAQDNSLGKGFCIGHSYFCDRDDYSDELLKSIVDYDILPTLKEYWFDNESEYEHWKGQLQGVFK